MALNSDGSGQWQTGNKPTITNPMGLPITSVLVSVNGPLEVRHIDELPTQATLEVHYRPLTNLRSIREVLIQDRICVCLESILERDLLPRSLVQVVVQALAANQSNISQELTCSINALCLALVDAGLPLKGIICAVCYAVVADKCILDPLPSDIDNASSTHVIAFLCKGEVADLVMVESTGCCSKDVFKQLILEAEARAADVYQEIRVQIEQQVQNKFKWLPKDKTSKKKNEKKRGQKKDSTV